MGQNLSSWCQPDSAAHSVHDKVEIDKEGVTAVSASVHDIPKPERRPFARAVSGGVPGAVSRFFEAAITCMPGDEHRGPEWEGTMTLERLQEMVNRMELHDLGEGELQRIWATMPKDENGGIDCMSFAQAVKDNVFLQSLIDSFDSKQRFNFTVPVAYDYSRTTNENYGVANREFVGKYAEFRAPLDYSYHCNYTAERQAWQDNAIASVVTKTNPQSKPWLVYTCGPMGVGKGFALSWMSKHGYFPLENIVHVDPDAFKLMMPEWPGYVDANEAEAGTQCHKESTFMMEIAQAVAMASRQNVWVDGSLRNAQFYRDQFAEVREKFPHYQISIFYVFATEECIRERIRIRAQKTGRDVPEALIKASLQAMDRSLNTLTPLCNFVARIDNNGAQPVLKAFETVNTTGVWDLIRNQFAQQADVGTRFPNALEPMLLQALPEALTKMLRTVKEGDQNKLIIDFNLPKGSAQGDDELATLVRKLSGMLKGSAKLSGSSRQSLTLPKASLERAGICHSAVKFMWVAAPRDYNGQRLDKVELESRDFSKQDQHHILVQFLRKGGFCYLDSKGEVVQFNVVSSSEHAVGRIQFGMPVEVPLERVDMMEKHRFDAVGSVLYRSLGATQCAWCVPGEHVCNSSGNDCPHGGFLYVLVEQGKRRAVLFPILH